MKLQRPACSPGPAGEQGERRHNGRLAVDRSNLRWCSDGFEIGCDNGEKCRVAFALDCCDCEAIAHVATTEGIKGEECATSSPQPSKAAWAN
jgi:putative transposase